MTLTEKKEINKLAVAVAGELSKLNNSYKQAIYNLLHSSDDVIYLKNLTSLIEYMIVDKEKPEHKILHESVSVVMCLSLSDYEYFIALTELEYVIKNNKIINKKQHKMTLKLEEETSSIIVFTSDEFSYLDYIQRWDYEDEEYIFNNKIHNNQLYFINKIISILEEGKKLYCSNDGNEWSILIENYMGKSKNYELIYSFNFDDDIRYDEESEKYQFVLNKIY